MKNTKRKKIQMEIGWADENWGLNYRSIGNYTALAGRYVIMNEEGDDVKADYDVCCSQLVAKKINNKTEIGSKIRFHGFAKCTYGEGEDFECFVEGKIKTRYF